MIVLDIETSGLNPRRNSLLSIGAVDYDTGDEFYGECRVYDGIHRDYPAAVIDDAALAINGFTREQCHDLAKDFDYSLYMRFLAWATNTKRDLLIAGQQVGGFDIPFLKSIADNPMHGIVPVWPFGYRSLDLHSVAFTKLGKSLSLDGILQAVGLAPEPKPHNALTGAKLEVEAFKRLL